MKENLRFNFFILTALLVLALIASLGCAKSSFNAGIHKEPDGVVNVPPKHNLDPITQVVAEANGERLGLGQSILAQGLSCTLFSTTGGDRIQSSIAGHNTLQNLQPIMTYTLDMPILQPRTSINEGMSLLPEPFRSMYKNMYLLECNGVIAITNTGYYGFALTTDDGGLFYVDGQLVADTDNNHAPLTVTGVKYLKRGVHSVTLKYAQTGAGDQALILMGRDANSEYDVIPRVYFYH